jgi:hypothetical protein
MPVVVNGCGIDSLNAVDRQVCEYGSVIARAAVSGEFFALSTGSLSGYSSIIYEVLSRNSSINRRMH